MSERETMPDTHAASAADQSVVPEWATIGVDTHVVPVDETLAQPIIHEAAATTEAEIPVTPALPVAASAPMTADAPAVPIAPSAPGAGVATLGSGKVKARWSLRKSLLVAAAALGIASVGAAGGAAAVALGSDAVNVGNGNSQFGPGGQGGIGGNGQFGPGQGRGHHDGGMPDGDGDHGGLPSGGMGRMDPNGQGQMDPNGGANSTNSKPSGGSGPST